MPRYIARVPAVAVGISKTHFAFFNNTGQDLLVSNLSALADGTVAVTGAVRVQLFTRRITDAPTGGTDFEAEGATLTLPTISKLRPNDANLLSGVVLQASPVGGATLGAILSEEQIHPEEAGSTPKPNTLLLVGGQPILVPSGSGIAVAQGAVVSVGAIIYSFTLENVG